MMAVFSVVVYLLFLLFLFEVVVFSGCLVRLRYFSLVVRKPVFGVSDQVPHKPGCTAIEDG